MLPDDERHGSEAGHEQHMRDGEDACQDCYRAKLLAGRRRTKRKAMGYRYTVPAHKARVRLQQWRDAGATYGEISDHVSVEESRVWEILNEPTPIIYTRTANAIMRAEGWPVTTESLTRRVRALCRLGWSIPRIAEACGVNHDTILFTRKRRPDFVSRKVRAGIVKGYKILANELPTGETQQERAGITRARNYAARQGWPSSWDFDDIDDLSSQPSSEPDKNPGGGLPWPEMLAEFAFFTDDCGMSKADALARLGVTADALEKAEKKRRIAESERPEEAA